MIDAEPCTEQACIRTASSKNELSQAFSLVYQRYLEAGLGERNSAQMRILPQHALPTTEVVVAGFRDDIFGTATLVRDNVLGLPIESAYGRDVQVRRSRSYCLAEISCLANRRGSTTRDALVELMAFTVRCAKSRNVDQILIAVHPRHVGFYTRYLGFEVFAGLRSYRSVCCNPAIGLCLDLNCLETRFPAAHRRLFGRSHPREQLAYRPLSIEAKRFVKRSLEAIESYDFSYRSAALAS